MPAFNTVLLAGQRRCVMVIHEISREQCLRVLARAWVARLACAHENQPYVVPVYLA
jgi:nitroimidazol reductase NimA-like FMN-containing flavoprotein (pyridoxamine 5'-phosphate oxidase superfamily)